LLGFGVGNGNGFLLGIDEYVLFGIFLVGACVKISDGCNGYGEGKEKFFLLGLNVIVSLVGINVKVFFGIFVVGACVNVLDEFNEIVSFIETLDKLGLPDGYDEGCT